MSFMVELKIGNSMAVVPSHKIGDSYYMDGSTSGKTEISYKYSQLLKILDDDLGLKWLSGKVASDTIERLEIAAQQLGTEPGEDIWKIDRGTVGHILKTLAGWAKANPTAVWEVS